MRLWRACRFSLWMSLAYYLSSGNVWAQRIAIITANSAAPLTKAQIAKVYLGRSFERKPYDLPEGSPLRTEFYRVATDSTLAQVRSNWARVMFTGRGEPPRELSDATAVKRAVAADALAVGYIEADAVDGTVKTVLVLP